MWRKDGMTANNNNNLSDDLAYVKGDLRVAPPTVLGTANDLSAVEARDSFDGAACFRLLFAPRATQSRFLGPAQSIPSLFKRERPKRLTRRATPLTRPMSLSNMAARGDGRSNDRYVFCTFF